MVSGNVGCCFLFFVSIPWTPSIFTGAKWCGLSYKWTFCAFPILCRWCYTCCTKSVKLTYSHNNNNNIIFYNANIQFEKNLFFALQCLWTNCTDYDITFNGTKSQLLLLESGCSNGSACRFYANWQYVEVSKYAMHHGYSISS